MNQGEFVTATQFMEAVMRRTAKFRLPPVPDPIARAYEVILFDWEWFSAGTMFQLFRALNGSSEEFFEGEEDALDDDDLAIAAALILARREGRYGEPEWQRMLDEVEGIPEKL